MMKIIAEAGLNFETFEGAIKYCDEAKKIGADIIKFQTTDVEKTWKRSTKEYQKAMKESFGEEQLPDIYYRILNMQLNDIQWKEVKFHCDMIGIEFLSTPSTIKKLKMLMSLGMKRIKIGSDRATEKELIKIALEYNVDVIVSNGLYPVNDKRLKKMYCVSQYPAMKENYDFTKIDSSYSGLSDHTLEYNNEWANKIKLCNLEYYEKHFSLNDQCIDAKNSLKPNQFRELIGYLR